MRRAAQLVGLPASGVLRYGNVAGKSAADSVAPSVYGNEPVEASAGTQPNTDGATESAADFPAAFPYLNTPLAGSPSN